MGLVTSTLIPWLVINLHPKMIILKFAWCQSHRQVQVVPRFLYFTCISRCKLKYILWMKMIFLFVPYQLQWCDIALSWNKLIKQKPYYLLVYISSTYSQVSSGYSISIYFGKLISETLTYIVHLGDLEWCLDIILLWLLLLLIALLLFFKESGFVRILFMVTMSGPVRVRHIAVGSLPCTR